MIVKKTQSDTRDLSNYRPISLTNTMYKIFVSLLQKRLASYFDDKIRPTQFGLRANRSASQPIHIMRRVLEAFERQQHPLHLKFLDGSKPSTLLRSKPLRQHLSILAFLLYFRRQSPYTLTQNFAFATQDKPLLYIRRQEDSDRDVHFLLVSLTLSSLIRFTM